MANYRILTKNDLRNHYFAIGEEALKRIDIKKPITLICNGKVYKDRKIDKSLGYGHLYARKEFFDDNKLEVNDRLVFDIEESSNTIRITIIKSEEIIDFDSLCETSLNSNKISGIEYIIDKIKKTYVSVVDEYHKTFIQNLYLPTKVANSSLVINGFTERNLTFNFCHSYLKLNPNAIVWQEIPIKNKDREHVDSIIIDKDFVIYLEAKRLYSLDHFKSLMKDFNRIKNDCKDIPIPRTKEPFKSKVVVLLADHYFSGKCKRKEYKEKYYDNFFTGQKNDDLSKIINKDTDLSKRIDVPIINGVCNDTQDIQFIKIPKEYKFNIDIDNDIVYTIYCGVCFLDGLESK